MSATIEMVESATKRIPQKELDLWYERALEVMQRVYLGQWRRVSNAINRADLATIEAFLSEVWRNEPDLIKAAVKPFYDEMVFGTAERSAEIYDLGVDWDSASEELFRISADRAGWFGRAMTETSMRQTQLVIRDWLQTEGSTVGELRDRVKRVWTGPRPNAAARTETTNMVAQSEVATWQAAGVWGYGINTRNDDRVRPSHERVAREGPYPLSDKEHLPPIFGDVNCRCTIYPVRLDPNANNN